MVTPKVNGTELERAELLLVQARLATAEGSAKTGVAKAKHAVELLAPTEWLDRQARSREALGEALLIAGETNAAANAFNEALQLFEQKGNVVARARLAAKAGGVRA